LNNLFKTIWQEAVWPGIALAIVAGSIWYTCGAITDELVAEVQASQYAAETPQTKGE
jgi:hypothetical protein